MSAIISDPVVVVTDPGTLTAATLQGSVVFPVDVDILGVTPSVTVAPAGSSAIWDVNIGGTTIFGSGTKPTIAAGSVVGPERLSATTNRRVAAGAIVTIDCDQIGSGTAGTNGSLSIRYAPASDTPTN